MKLLYALCLTACFSCRQGEAHDGKSTTAFGPEAAAEKGPVARQVVVDGHLYSPSSKPLVIQRIRWYWDYNISWTADEGSLVKAGDTVIKLDPSTVQKDLTDKQLELEQQKLELEEEKLRSTDEIAEAQSQVTSNEFDLKKKELLVTNSDSVSEAEKRKQRLEVEGAKATLRRSREKVASTKERTARKIEARLLRVKKVDEEVTEMQAGLDKMELKAPQDGLVIFPLYSSNAGWQKARPGGGVQVNTTVAEISDPKDLVARLYVPEIDADGIVAATPGELTLDIAPGLVLKGTVKSLTSVPSTAAERDGNKSPKPADNVRQFEVLFAMDELPPQAMPGMTVRVTLTPVARERVVRLPTEALTAAPTNTDAVKPSPYSSGDTAYVSVKSGGGKWEWRPVKLGAQSLTHAEVVEGLSEGETFRTVAW